ncbi:hypothetical protein PI124_g11907 [Phytophthora idaei]|nr:hypothetical protein PI125_g14346 [Phytophthora idaei]KAG3145961.1 hypothetical protein PI126_g13523 [Phytophthora idaei]KAG3243280.1 hypothetical protein PI124_g11907 [Phytophthora idaei]
MSAAKAFVAALAQTGTSLTSKDLLEQSPSTAPSINSVPIVLEKCKFFDIFDADPAEARASMKRKREKAEEQHGAEFLRQILSSNIHHPLKQKRSFDFRLEPEEKTKLAANGVVAPQRFGFSSFGDIYYRLYSDDLPVFVTSDSILHAWHRSFDAFLVDIEENCLFPALRAILEDSLSECIAMAENVSEDHEKVIKAVKDVEIYLSMGLSLLRGKLLGGHEEMETLWSAILNERTDGADLFSAERTVDFSQLKPRGHYTKSEPLKRYFRAMMWFGIVDLRIAGDVKQDDGLHQLLCSVILVNCLQESDPFDDVVHFDNMLSSLVAEGGHGSDSLSANEFVEFVQSTLMEKLIERGKTGIEEWQKLLQDLQRQLVQNSSGSQFSDDLLPAPISFRLLGQRFVWSAFIFFQLENAQVEHDGTMQPRRDPSALDVACTLFGNNEAAQELAARMDVSRTHRNDISISSKLVALRRMMDEMFVNENECGTDPASETASISTLWLQALRALSKSSPNSANTFHSGTWQRR